MSKGRTFMRMFAEGLKEAVLHPFAILQKNANLDRALPPTRVRNRLRSQNPWGDNILQSLAGSYFEEDRLTLYGTYWEMSTDPVVGSVLNLVAEDATMPDYDRGVRVWCEAKTSEVQKLIEAFLRDIEVEKHAYSIVRAMAQFGDCFEELPSTRDKGICGFIHLDPANVGRLQNELGQLVAFGPVDATTGDVRGREEKSLIPYWQVAHWRLLGRDRASAYGDSILYWAREAWRQLQLMIDQIVMQRLLRRPDRLMYIVDKGGMSFEDAENYVFEMEQRIQKEWYLSPQQGRFESEGSIPDMKRDMVFPIPTGNGTKIENFPATNQNDLMRDFDRFVSRLTAALNVPRGFLGLTDQGVYQNDKSIGRQDAQYAKRSMRIQQAFLDELMRVVATHLAYHNVDASLPQNEFRLQMAPVSTYIEYEMKEIQKLRADLARDYLGIASVAGVDGPLWRKYVLTKIVRLPDSMVDLLMAPQEEQAKVIEALRKHGVHDLDSTLALFDAIRNDRDLEKVVLAEVALRASQVSSKRLAQHKSARGALVETYQKADLDQFLETHHAGLEKGQFRSVGRSAFGEEGSGRLTTMRTTQRQKRMDLHKMHAFVGSVAAMGA